MVCSESSLQLPPILLQVGKLGGITMQGHLNLFSYNCMIALDIISGGIRNLFGGREIRVYVCIAAQPKYIIISDQ